MSSTALHDSSQRSSVRPAVTHECGTTMPSARPSSSGLVVQREDIRWWTVAPGIEQIEVTVHNVSDVASVPARLRLRSARFGVFLPWRPLGELDVPPIEPGGLVRLTFLASTEPDGSRRPSPTHPPAGGRGGAGTRGGAPDGSGEDDVPRPMTSTLRGPLAPLPPAFEDREDVLADAARWLFAAQRSERAAWVGNVDVFVRSGCSAERHRAAGLGIVAGVKHVAHLLVGSGRDAYRFELLGDAEAWQAKLRHTFIWGRGKRPGPDRKPVTRTEWVGFNGTGVFALSFQPPEDATTGTIDVSVTRRSTGEVAVAEFGLDAAL